ncbi:UNVERIFIED_CONTAM: hypothetical protein Slati_3152900 [Sesamum latifolium]|uniref:Uncharacterized protein n=1 Tax=Sesamum latifolium TaxID=2727402 RepID=A0AAW2UV05_9LAMI
MVSTSTLSLCSHPKINFGFQNKQRNELWTMSSTRRSSLYRSSPGKISPFTPVRIILRHSHLKKFNIKAAASGSGGRSSGRGASSRRVYKQAEAQAPVAPVKEIASFVLPAGAFVVATFVLWKLVEKILLPKPSKSVAEENKPAQGVKWSFAPGTNLLSSFGAKIERESKLRLNDFAKELRSFQSVDMSGRNFGDEGLFFVAESLAYNQCLCDILVDNSGIQKLQLSSSAFGDEGAKAIAEMLKKNSTLRVIELNNNFIDYSGFSSLAGAILENKSLLSIYLNGNYGGPLGAAALAKGLEGNKSVRELYLQGNSIGDEGVRALMSGLSSHKVLIFVQGAEKIAEALKQNRSITNVDLGGNDIHAKGISEIARVLKDNSVITTLELGYNPIGPEGAKALAEVLKFHGNIKDLMLGWCQIGATGAEYIADMLKYNSTISSLDLRANGLRDEGAICLARSLKVVNEALTSLNLGFNEIRDEGAFAIAQALKANEDVRLTSLNLMNNFLTKLGQSAITDASDHVYEMNEKELNIVF